MSAQGRVRNWALIEKKKYSAVPGFNLHTSLLAKTAIIGFLATFIVVTAAAINFRQADRIDFYEHCYQDTANVLLSALDPRFQTKATEVARVAERMVVVGAIKGGVIFDASGHLLQTFGERIDTDFQTVFDTGRRIFRPSANGRLEFYYSPDVSHTSFHIIARYDTAGVEAIMRARENRMVVVAVGGGLAGAVAVGLFFLIFVSLPIRRIKAAIDAALADPANADAGKSLTSGGSEIGRLAMTVECLRSKLADIWRNKVLVAQGVLETSPFAIIQMNGDGLPVFANPASIEIFGRDVAHNSTGGVSGISVQDVESGQSLKVRSFVEEYADALRLVAIATPAGERFALMTSRKSDPGSRSPMTILLATDVTALQTARLDAETRHDGALSALRMAGLREFELKMMLEGCLALIGGSAGSDVHVDPTPIAREWLEGARDEGFLSDFACVEEAPQVAGGEDNLRSAIRLAMICAAARAPSIPVFLDVDFRGINFDTAGVEITARSSGGPLSRPNGLDGNLTLAALRVAIRRIGGHLGEITADEEASVLRLTLRGAAERVSTGMASKAKA